MKNRGSFGVHFGPTKQSGGAALFGQKPVMSLRKFVTNAERSNYPEATARSPRENEMGGAMKALYGWVRTDETQGWWSRTHTRRLNIRVESNEISLKAVY